jgi:hypothetical protein
MKPFLAILFTLFFITAFATDDEDIIKLVNQWNELHNTRNTSGFLKLYAPEVLFYGNQNSASQCYWSKEKFLNSKFNQEIISPITITRFTSGTSKAEFIKRTISNKKT